MARGKHKRKRAEEGGQAGAAAAQRLLPDPLPEADEESEQRSEAGDRRSEAGDRRSEGTEAPLLPPGVERWLRKNGAVLGISLALAVATFAVYYQTIGFDFVSHDDFEYVLHNDRVKAGFTAETLRWALTGVHSTVGPQTAGPLTTLLHVLNWDLYGEWAGGHHLTNLLLHAAGSVVLFLALRRLTGATWRSGLVAALFCLHPAHVESVAWISELKGVLSGLFFGLTLWAYAGYVAGTREVSRKGAKAQRSGEQGAQPVGPPLPPGEGWGEGTFPWGRYLLVVALFALGLLSKPMLVTLPLVLLLLDFWPLGRWKIRGQSSEVRGQWRGAPPSMLLLEKLPLFALSAVSCVVTYWVQRSAGAVRETIDPAVHLQTIVLGYVRYLAMLAWPFSLAAAYPRDTVASLAVIVACSLALIAVSVLVLLTCRRRRQYVLVGWFWFLVMIAPVSGIIVLGNQSVADRYTYLPYTGLFIALVWGAAELVAPRAGSWEWGAGRKKKRRDVPSPPAPLPEGEGSVAPRWAWGAAGLVLAFLAFRSVQQTYCWADSVALWRNAADVSSDNPQYRTRLGVELVASGDVQDGVAELQAATKLGPHDARARHELAKVYHSLGRLADAERQWRAALAIEPNFPAAAKGLGLVLAKSKRGGEALPYLRAALAAAPRDSEARLAAMYASLSAGEVDDAMAEFRAGLAQDPTHRLFLDDLAKLAAKRPKDVELRGFRAFALLEAKQAAEAAGEFRAVLGLDPANLGALNGLAWIEATHPDARLRNGKEAVTLAEKAAGLNKDDARTLDTLAAAYAAAGRFQDAARTARKAAQLAEKAADRGLSDSIAAHLKLYEAGKPLRDESLAK